MKPFIEMRWAENDLLQYRIWKVDIGLGNRIGPRLGPDEEGSMVPQWTEWMNVKLAEESVDRTKD